MTAKQSQGLSDVIDYAVQICKTQITDENAEILRHHATGINCTSETACWRAPVRSGELSKRKNRRSIFALSEN
jgi:hypothetical protein